MASKDLSNNIVQAISIVPAVQSASVNGSGVDLAGFESATVAIHTGAIVGSAVMVPKLQDSADNSTFADVAAGDLIGSFPASLAASTAYDVGYKGNKRYVRVVFTLSSGTSIAASAAIIKGHPRNYPAA